MTINERDGRTETVRRGAAQRIPRSGGRTTVQRATQEASRNSGRSGAAVAGGTNGHRSGRHYDTQGTAALRVEEPMRIPDSVAAAPVSRLRVAPPMPVSAPRAPFVALVLVVVVAGVLGILMINVKTSENAFRLDRLQDQKAALDIQQQQLEKQIVENESAGSLRAAARRLGLVTPGPPAFIRLPDGKIIGVPQPAGGAPAITSQQGAGGQGTSQPGAGQPGAGGQGAGR